jgi:hypothetical protein
MTPTPIWKWLLVCAALLPGHAALAGAQRAWNFDVILDGEVIGQHRFEIFERDKTRHVEIEANFDVRILFFNAYRYRHSNYEVWQGECLQSIRSHTNDNGDKEFVRGEMKDGFLKLQTDAGTETLQGCVRTFAYWDPAILNSNTLLNAQTGELQPVQVKDLGSKTIQVRGESVQARHYRIDTAKFSIELWYSLQQQWLALQSTTANGAVLRYRLQ